MTSAQIYFKHRRIRPILALHLLRLVNSAPKILDKMIENDPWTVVSQNMPPTN